MGDKEITFPDRLWEAIRFGWQCLKWAYSRWERGEAGMTSALSVLFALLGLWGVKEGFSGNTTWFYALLPFIGMVMFVAPYNLWKQQKKRADSLEESIKPRLEILEFRRQGTGAYRDGFCWGLRIRNNGIEPAENCECRLLEISLESRIGSLEQIPIDKKFHWSGQPENIDTYTIQGKQIARLNVVYYDYIDSERGIPDSITLAYRMTPQLRLKYELSALLEPIILVFCLTSEGKTPQYIVSRIDLKELVKDLLVQPEPPCKIIGIVTEWNSLVDFMKVNQRAGD